MKILIIDDSKIRTEQIVHYLTSNNFASECIEVCTNSNAAKIILRSTFFDILLLDVVLPKRENEVALPSVGLNLLKSISTNAKYIKPGRIIGITGYDDDIINFREQFEKYCFSIISTSHLDGAWLSKLLASINYAASSKLGQINDKFRLNVLTVHGIKTFGAWQTNLERLIKSHCKDVRVNTYKYGLYSAISFAIPFIRAYEVKRLTKQLRDIFDRGNDEHLVIFSHSFGTYLVAHSLKLLHSEGVKLNIKLIVTSGSVLPNKFDWSFLLKSSDAKIINDCGTSDNVLLLSEALVYGTGMAGRTGFHSLLSERLINRYFDGGHSHYFESSAFMNRYWLPLLELESPVSTIDNRVQSFLIHEILEKFIYLIGKIKPSFYLAIISVLLYYAFKLIYIYNNNL